MHIGGRCAAVAGGAAAYAVVTVARQLVRGPTGGCLRPAWPRSLGQHAAPTPPRPCCSKASVVGRDLARFARGAAWSGQLPFDALEAELADRCGWRGSHVVCCLLRACCVHSGPSMLCVMSTHQRWGRACCGCCGTTDAAPQHPCLVLSFHASPLLAARSSLRALAHWPAPPRCRVRQRWLRRSRRHGSSACTPRPWPPPHPWLCPWRRRTSGRWPSP